MKQKKFFKMITLSYKIHENMRHMSQVDTVNYPLDKHLFTIIR